MAIALPTLPDWWDSLLVGMELLASKGASKGLLEMSWYA